MKVFFIIFKELLMKKTTQIFSEGESPTFKMLFLVKLQAFTLQIY